MLSFGFAEVGVLGWFWGYLPVFCGLGWVYGGFGDCLGFLVCLLELLFGVVVNVADLLAVSWSSLPGLVLDCALGVYLGWWFWGVCVACVGFPGLGLVVSVCSGFGGLVVGLVWVICCGWFGFPWSCGFAWGWYNISFCAVGVVVLVVVVGGGVGWLCAFRGLDCFL